MVYDLHVVYIPASVISFLPSFCPFCGYTPHRALKNLGREARKGECGRVRGGKMGGFLFAYILIHYFAAFGILYKQIVLINKEIILILILIFERKYT